MTIGQRGELGDFLRRRREALTPAAAGIAVGERRRTPGRSSRSHDPRAAELVEGPREAGARIEFRAAAGSYR